MSATIIPLHVSWIVRLPMMTPADQARLAAPAERIRAAVENAASLPAGGNP